MTIRALFASSLLTAALLSGAAFADEKTYDLSGFEGVSVSAGITAEVTVGGDYSVRAESTAKGLERLRIEVKGDELNIGRKSQLSWRRNEKVTVYVSLPALKSLEASSGSDANASGVAGGAFALDASSGASADVAGSCSALSLDVSSGASIDASELICESADADASTGASAKLHASNSVVADASTGASIRVYGAPENVDTDTSTGASVKIVN